MRKLTVLALLLVLLSGCSDEQQIPQINGTPVEVQPVEIAQVERVLSVEVSEDDIPTPVSDYTYTEDMISFSNRRHEVYSGDSTALHVQEAENNTHFIVNQGHHLLLDKSSLSYLVEYTEIDTRRETITFTLLHDTPELIVVHYTPSDQWSNKLIFGEGILEFEELTFPFTIGYKAGNPLAFDLNGDRIINQSRTMVHTSAGAEHKPRGIIWR